MQSLVDKHLGCKFIFGGDYNIEKCSVSNQCAYNIENFLIANQMYWLDHSSDKNMVYTFHNLLTYLLTYLQQLC